MSAVLRLNSINVVKKIPLGQFVSKQSLVLLYWFSNTFETLSNVIWLNFDPNNMAHIFEGLLEPLPQRHQYYTVGNLNQDSSVELPSYGFNQRTADMGRNGARIIVGVRGLNTGW